MTGRLAGWQTGRQAAAKAGIGVPSIQHFMWLLPIATNHHMQGIVAATCMHVVCMTANTATSYAEG
jgi:hypothetical protein